MSEAFVWFHLSSDKQNEAKGFYEGLFGWSTTPGPGGMTMFAGQKGPFAACGERYGDAAGWIPFVQVKDVDAATREALELGAALVKGKTRGPAGEFSVVRDPAGAVLALWQQA